MHVWIWNMMIKFVFINLNTDMEGANICMAYIKPVPLQECQLLKNERMRNKL